MADDLTPEQKTAIAQEVRAIIRRSNLWSPTDPPDAVAALMVMHLARHIGMPHEAVPQALLEALAGLLDHSGTKDG